MKLDCLLDYLHTLYYHERADSFGLVVKGSADINRIALVYDFEVISSHLSRLHPDLVISHHPLHGENMKNAQYAGISVAVYHLVMDRHDEIGHNRLMLERLKMHLTLSDEERFGHFDGYPLGYSATLAGPTDVGEVVSAIESGLGVPVCHAYDANRKCERIAVFSGAAGSVPRECLDQEIDTLITGSYDRYRAHHDIIGFLMVQDPGDYNIGAVSRRAEVLNLLKVFPLGHEESELFGLYALKERLESTFPVKANVYCSKYLNRPIQSSSPWISRD
jgi:putative NIF3 family GTP cyclohydrolase 1 type 2